MAPMQISSASAFSTNVSIKPRQQAQRGNAVTTRALFTKKKPAPVVEEKPAAPARRSFFGKTPKKEAAKPVAVEEKPARRSFFGKTPKKEAAKPVAVEEKPARRSLFGGAAKKKEAETTEPLDKAAEYKKRESVLSAFDFSAARSNADAKLLYDARYGDLKDGKMSREQYLALQRKVGGTAKSFFKESIDVKGKYTDQGWTDTTATSSSVPALPFLVAIVLALFGTVGYVVTQTSQ